MGRFSKGANPPFTVLSGNFYRQYLSNILFGQSVFMIKLLKNNFICAKRKV